MIGKIAFITGASRGLGRSIALQLAKAGVGIVGTYHSAQTKADTLVREITEAGGKATMLQLDLDTAATFEAFKTRLQEVLRSEFGRDDLDFVVQNAGNGIAGTCEEMTGEKLDALYRVHFKGPFLLNQALLPLIVRGGRIINFSTAATRFTLEKHGPYSAIKSAVEVITMYMAKELGQRGITVNVVAPAAIETDFMDGEVRDNAKLHQSFADATPLGRVGLPDDIGTAVAGLLSSNFGWLNGQRIEVSGGQSL